MTREIALHCMKSASELEGTLCEECPIYGQTGCDHCFEDALQYVIRMLEQKPKIGHWIMTGDYYTGAYGTIDYVRCSCCHEDSLEEGNYCPNCGAKMEDE